MTIPGGGEHHFPGYDVVGQAGAWDEVTAGVVLSRLGPLPPVRFFTPEEEPTARALVDRLLAQDSEPRVPVLEMIDQRLLHRQGDGFRYHDMPEDPDAWRRSVAAVDEDCRRELGRPFWDLDRAGQIDWLERFREQDGVWHGMPPGRVFNLWSRYACDAFYSHPWAWNEIGFGGPAYPRGYKNLGIGRREPWEVGERDPIDPVPWADRVEAARKRHAGSGG